VTRRQLAKLVEAWRKVLTPEWRITLMDEPPPDEDMANTWACCQTNDDYLHINVHFTDELLKENHRKIEITVVHELLHAITRPWRRLVDAVEDDLPARAHRVLTSEQEHQEEAFVDRLSCVIVAQTHGSEAFGTIERSKDDED
jgi:hypothetical protein